MPQGYSTLSFRIRVLLEHRREREMTVTAELRRPSPVIAIFCFLCFCSLSQKSNGQNATATTDPAEVRALNSLFKKWDTHAVGLWNISGKLCSGSAVNDTNFEDANNNPSIKCDCTYNSNTTCHITKLRVFDLNRKGEIPEEITAFTKLTFLKIDKNYFTGSLPSFIGNLSALSLLSIASNAFSGPIPKELGNLKELIVLSFGLNNFSGTLPPELGNLVKLEQLYIDSCGLGGEIPSQFAKLRSMRIMSASDNPFIGNIPDFIRNWTNLTILRFYGNSLEGPIPSSFSNLISLESLRISDLSNVSSSLDFTKDMKNLTYLELRNALISGTISSFIGDHQSLQYLDLSFNNLTGEIPNALFNLDSLTSLFLGNNSLSGALPAQKSEQLVTIDLSYNELSGTFPSWLTSSQRFVLNLVANNFTFDDSNTSVFPGLNCLQRNFPCHRDNPLYANFSLNCGGSEMTTAGITYEAENSPLSAVSYYITNSDKWAVNQVGLFTLNSPDSNTPYIENRTYVENSNTTYVENTFLSELFRTSRISPGSLRYYGLGLENGPYTLSLSFLETAFDDPSSQTWKSLGRQEFDIYIQGELKLKDFDISKEAGEAGRAIVKKFNYNVSENYLEIHLFWAGKGTCCIPNNGYYGLTISTLSVVSDFTPTVSGNPPTIRDGGSSSTPNITGSSSGLNIRLKFAIGISAAVAGSIIVVFALCFLRREGILYKPTIFWRKKTKNDLDVDAFIKDNGSLLALKQYRYSDVKKITKSFTDKLGQGGYGCVYKGKLSDGCLVAVKVLNESKGNGEEFLNEVASISRTSHVNVVTLLGFCYERTKRALIYKFMPNGSLDQFIYIEKSSNTHNQLEWQTLYQIAVGIARGLEYLHIGCNMRILHFDIKPHNILLDEEFCPKISDFRLAKLCQRKESIISMQGARGTAGYIAPEVFNRHYGGVSYKSDVYSYGMMVLEIVGGRRNIEVGVSHTSEIYFPHWIFKYLEPASTELRLNRVITEEEEEELARKMTLVGLWCIQTKPSDRPSMTKVVEMLEGNIQSIQIPPKPFLSSPPRSLPQHSSSVSVPESSSNLG